MCLLLQMEGGLCIHKASSFLLNYALGPKTFPNVTSPSWSIKLYISLKTLHTILGLVSSRRLDYRHLERQSSAPRIFMSSVCKSMPLFAPHWQPISILGRRWWEMLKGKEWVSDSGTAVASVWISHTHHICLIRMWWGRHAATSLKDHIRFRDQEGAKK